MEEIAVSGGEMMAENFDPLEPKVQLVKEETKSIGSFLSMIINRARPYQYHRVMSIRASRVNRIELARSNG